MLNIKSCIKINLTLDILGKNKYGYNNIDSKFLFLDDIYDEIIIDESLNFRNCNVIYLDKNNCSNKITNNSIDLIANILFEYFGQSIMIPQATLLKRLPISSGLGGGSGNGSCYAYNVLKLNEVPFDQQVNFLKYSSRKIGDDGTTFLYKYIYNKKHIRVCGSSFDLDFYDYDTSEYEGKTIFLLNNRSETCTKDVYETASKYGITMQEASIRVNGSVTQILNQLNKLNPYIYGISGSGPTCFSLFESEKLNTARLSIAEIAHKYGCLWWESGTMNKAM